MQTGQPSRTALSAAIHRAAHQFLEQGRIFSDPLAVRILAQTPEAILKVADAYPEQKFDAVVSYINPGVDITRASVEVKLDVAKPPAYLIQDMTVSVDIEVGRSDKALTLSGRAVHDAISTAPWVMGISKGRAVKIPVKLGLRGDTAMEIKTGLNEGDIAIPVASPTVVGQRVRAQAP